MTTSSSIPLFSIPLLLVWTTEFHRMVRPIEYAPFHLSLEEVAEHLGHKVLIAADRWGDLEQPLRSHSIGLVNIFILTSYIIIQYYLIKFKKKNHISKRNQLCVMVNIQIYTEKLLVFSALLKIRHLWLLQRVFIASAQNIEI